jgi:hypothetical protein
MRISICLIFLLLQVSLIWGQDGISVNSDRPAQCYSTTTVPKGLFQLETGLGLDLLDGQNVWSLSATDFRYGVVKNFEFRTGLRVNMIQEHTVPEMNFDGAMTAGFKWGIVNKKVKLIYLAEAYIPAYPAIVNAYHLLEMSHAVGKKVSFCYMFLHRYDFGQLQTPDYAGGLQFSYGVSGVLHGKLSAYFEFSGMWDSSSPNAVQVLYNAALMYMIKDNIQIDLFFGHGLNYKHGTYGIGLSWLLLKKK